MKRKVRLDKASKIKRNLIIVVMFIVLLATSSFIYSLSLLSGIENKIRLLLSIDLIIILVGILVYFIRFINKKNRGKKLFIIILIITLIYSFSISIGSFYLIKTYKVVDKMTTDSTTYSSSIVTLSNNKVDKINKIDSHSKIGMINDDTSIEGYQIPQDIVKEQKIEQEIVDYDSYIEAINALYDKKVDYIFLPTSYVSMFSTMEEVELEDIGDKTKIIYSKKEIKKSKKVSKPKSLTKPFTVLIMGVDSDKKDLANASFNGDALLLVTFNPTTLNTTMLSIPRDSYVPIACFSGKTKNKITHAAWYGESCMMETIEDFTDVDIDYYVKINFKGVVNVIDALGGVDVDVPYSFCEQDSNRNFGNSTIYVKKGLQNLNGEQALAFSRNRKSHSDKCGSKWTSGARNDFIRGQNQQLVLKALLNKIKVINSVDKIYDVLDQVSSSMTTNMTTSEILSLYNVGKDIIRKSNNEKLENLLGIQKLYLNGKDARIYDSRTGLRLYNYVLYENSLKAVTKAMKVNLEKTKPTLVKKFAFSITKEYEQEVIGKSETGASTASTSSGSSLPSFVGLTESSAKTKASKLGISVSIKYSTSGSGTNGTVLYQSVSAGTDLSGIKSITLTVIKKSTTSTTTTVQPTSSTSSQASSTPASTSVSCSSIVEKQDCNSPNSCKWDDNNGVCENN